MQTIHEIKARLDIVEIAGEHLQLQHNGKNWKACCPFHEDKTPSFVIFPESQRWKCFGIGCGLGGDLFDLVQRIQKWDFPTTLRHLAERAGVELHPLSAQEQAAADLKRQREQVFGAAMAYFQQYLFRPVPKVQGTGETEQKPDLDYALARGWTRESLAESGMGSFGKDREGLRRFLKAAGVDLSAPAAVALVGLRGDIAGWADAHGIAPAKSWLKDQRIPGMPANMLVYPHMERGRVAYLAGRKMEEKGHWNPPRELAGARQPFYNLHWWKPSPGPALIVEGQGDALTLAQWGIPAVALAGCSLAAYSRGREADEQGDASHDLIESLLQKGRSGRVTIALDTDAAGKEASAEAAHRLLDAGLHANQIGLLAWPQGDANDWLADGAEAAEALELIESSPTWLDELIRVSSVAPEDGSALRAVFEALTPLNEYELVSYRSKVCSLLRMQRGIFDRLLRSARMQEAGDREDSPAPFLVLGGCTYLRKHDSKGSTVLEKLSNFSARIVQESLRDNGQEIERELRISGEIDGQPLPLAQVRAAEFYQMDWTLREWGAGSIIEAGPGKRDNLRAAIQYLSSDFDRRTIYTHTGWRMLGCGERAYLSGSGALGQPGVEVELDGDMIAYRLPEEPHDPVEAMQASLKFINLAAFNITVPLWASIWLAPLGEFIHPAFVVWLYGRTGTLKSTLAALVLNHFGADFDGFHFPASFLDTSGRLEQKAFLAKDAVLVVDDYAPQKESRLAQEYKRAASQLVRSVGNRAGRGRLTREIKARLSHTPRALVMVTGEELPDTESLVARLFGVEFHQDSVDIERLSAMQAQREIYVHAMAGYLGWLQEHWAGYVEAIPKRLRHYRTEASGSGVHLRLPDTIAFLMVGWEMGLRYALSIGALPASDYKLLMDFGWTALLENGADMALLAGEEKPEELFLGAFRELLAQGVIYLRERDGEQTIGGPGERPLMMGWYDEAHVYLLPEASYTLIAKHFRDQGAVFPVRAFTLRKSLKEAGLLLDEKGRMTRSMWIDGRTHRIMVLKRSVLGEV